MTGQASGSFTASVVKDSLVFSAAHFITFNGNVCERLHGHNWRVSASVDGQLDENGYVYDFIAIRDSLAKIVAELDHRVLLPQTHPLIHVSVSEGDSEVTATFEQRRWVFPFEDCRILPIANTTAELIASWIAQEMVRLTGLDSVTGIRMLRVGVEENFGQWAEYRLPLNGGTLADQ
ncbi:MAG: 6-pyruvoyl trahydropterin synthase family protein [Planctomyces sp.]|jgi:6-pyruvoyltetrahydropterin/6-carboxytetrahydropterin synthase